MKSAIYGRFEEVNNGRLKRICSNGRRKSVE